MKKQSKSLIITFALALACAFTATPAKAQQSLDQIAIQLGAIQFGIADIATATAQQQADALVQGRLALAATQATYNAANFVPGATPEPPQSATFRDQLYQATEKALSNPLTVAVNATVTVGGSTKPTTVRATLNPADTTASAILDQTVKRLPNNGPGLVGQAVAAAVALPQVFGQPGAIGLTDANLAAGLAMRATLATYSRGTQQWAGVPPLPNFGRRPVGVVPPNPNGLMDAASAVAANAINGLGALKLSPNSVFSMTAALVGAAARSQRNSETIVAGNSPRFGGAVGASSTGIVAQVAGNQNATWSGNPVLQAVVNGAFSAARKQAVPIAYGVAAGFAGTYLGSGGALASFDKNTVAADILASLQFANAVTTKNQASVSAAILAGLNVGLDQSNWNDPVNGVAGIGGIQNFTVINGGGAPLTDTVGL